jgi:hypothetical protein
VPVVEIAGHRGDGIDPAHYLRFNQAMALLRQGQSPEVELINLQCEWPDDHVIPMCLERLRTTNENQRTQIIFEFDSK